MKKFRNNWQKQGFNSYLEWFQMRNRIYRLIWKDNTKSQVLYHKYSDQTGVY